MLSVRRISTSRRSIFATALLLALFAISGIPALVDTLTHGEFEDTSYYDMAGRATPQGHIYTGSLRVTSCVPARFLIGWKCYGDFFGVDGAGEDVPVANDFRYHRRGDVLDVNMVTDSRRTAFIWGRSHLYAMYLLIPGVLLSCAALTLALIRWIPLGLVLRCFTVGAACLAPLALSALQYAV